MITMMARGLVNFAADRWAPHLRADVRREWLAELAVLTAAGERWKSLRFAASLAAHPSHRPEAAPVPIRLWYAIRVLLIGPALCTLLQLVSFFGMTVLSRAIVIPMTPFADPFEVSDWAMTLQLPSLSVLSVLSAYLAARIGRRWSPDAPGFLLPVLIATVPAFLAAAAMYTATGNGGKAMRHLTVFEIYFLGFAAILYAVARLARAGRPKRAWWLGIAGAIVMLDIAVIPPILGIELPPEEGTLNPAYAPMWLIALLTDTGFGPTRAEVFAITDVLVGVPQMVIILSGWALGMVVGVQNRASSSSSALATASESPPSTLM
jgi:hypothetical protein